MLLERILRKRYQARKVCKDNDSRLEDRTKPDISIVVNEFRFIWILESLEILISIGTKRIKMVTRSKLFRLQSVRTLTIHQKSREFLEEFRVNFETIYEEIGYMISTSQTHRAELMYRKKVVQRGEKHSEIDVEKPSTDRFASIADSDSRKRNDDVLLDQNQLENIIILANVSIMFYIPSKITDNKIIWHMFKDVVGGYKVI
ncbi:Hypothetical_protein [Hexamita inflata]|uniref:Hypothetical_protein n=1 Tax=Hexamita inflata TaxID=28002 RepID=A0AA86PIE1_9EUKA|nr:Hypothetical protein HINF_LOCUS26636 [Hexamita inflata]